MTTTYAVPCCPTCLVAGLTLHSEITSPVPCQLCHHCWTTDLYVCSPYGEAG